MSAAWEFREVTPLSAADDHSVLMVVRTSPLLLSRSASGLSAGWTASLPGGLPDYDDVVGFRRLIDTEEALVWGCASTPQARRHGDRYVCLSETDACDHVSPSGSERIQQRGFELSMPRGPARLQLALRRRGLTHGLRFSPDRESYTVAWELDAVFYGEGEPWTPDEFA